jgi:hypothetical protein
MRSIQSNYQLFQNLIKDPSKTLLDVNTLLRNTATVGTRILRGSAGISGIVSGMTAMSTGHAVGIACGLVTTVLGSTALAQSLRPLDVQTLRTLQEHQKNLTELLALQISSIDDISSLTEQLTQSQRHSATILTEMEGNVRDLSIVHQAAIQRMDTLKRESEAVYLRLLSAYAGALTLFYTIQAQLLGCFHAFDLLKKVTQGFSLTRQEIEHLKKTSPEPLQQQWVQMGRSISLLMTLQSQQQAIHVEILQLNTELLKLLDTHVKQQTEQLRILHVTGTQQRNFAIQIQQMLSHYLHKVRAMVHRRSMLFFFIGAGCGGISVLLRRGSYRSGWLIAGMVSVYAVTTHFFRTENPPAISKQPNTRALDGVSHTTVPSS